MKEKESEASNTWQAMEWWLASIAVHAPNSPVAIVGTHNDCAALGQWGRHFLVERLSSFIYAKASRRTRAGEFMQKSMSAYRLSVPNCPSSMSSGLRNWIFMLLTDAVKPRQELQRCKDILVCRALQRQLQINEQTQLCFFPVDNACTDGGSCKAALDDWRLSCVASISASGSRIGRRIAGRSS